MVFAMPGADMETSMFDFCVFLWKVVVFPLLWMITPSLEIQSNNSYSLQFVLGDPHSHAFALMSPTNIESWSFRSILCIVSFSHPWYSSEDICL